MFRVLGTKRVLLLVILVAVNVAMASTVYLFMIPQHLKKQRDLSTVRGTIASVGGDISRMQIEFDQLATQKDRFEQLKKQGFFYNQDRREAEIVLEKIQKQAGVISAVANIQAGEVEPSDEAVKADYEVLKSPMKIHIDAIDAVDVFRYIYLLNNYFPGHLTFEDVDLARAGEVTGTVLRSIASGENPVLVKADIAMTWRTMLPKSEIINTTPATGASQ